MKGMKIRHMIYYSDDDVVAVESSADAYAHMRQRVKSLGIVTKGPMFTHDEANVSYVYLSHADMVADKTGDKAFCVFMLGTR